MAIGAYRGKTGGCPRLWNDLGLYCSVGSAENMLVLNTSPFSPTGRDRRMQEIQPVAGPCFRSPRAAMEIPQGSGSFLPVPFSTAFPSCIQLNHRWSCCRIFFFFFFHFTLAFSTNIDLMLDFARALVSDCFGPFLLVFLPLRCLNSIPIDFLRVAPSISHSSVLSRSHYRRVCE